MGCSNNNQGCKCGTNCRKGVLATLQTGDTFPVHMTLKDDGVVSALPQGYSILIGFYDRSGNLLLDGATGTGGRITYSDGSYHITVSHEESVLMKKAVFVELTVTDGSGGVYHGDGVASIAFEPRLNNQLTQ